MCHPSLEISQLPMSQEGHSILELLTSRKRTAKLVRVQPEGRIRKSLSNTANLPDFWAACALHVKWRCPFVALWLQPGRPQPEARLRSTAIVFRFGVAYVKN